MCHYVITANVSCCLDLADLLLYWQWCRLAWVPVKRLGFVGMEFLIDPMHIQYGIWWYLYVEEHMSSLNRFCSKEHVRCALKVHFCIVYSCNAHDAVPSCELILFYLCLYCTCTCIVGSLPVDGRIISFIDVFAVLRLAVVIMLNLYVRRCLLIQGCQSVCCNLVCVLSLVK